MTDNTKLSACPMCGADPIEDGKDEYLSIRCEGCGLRGPTFSFEYTEDEEDVERARADAIEHWNVRAGARATDAPAQGERTHVAYFRKSSEYGPWIECATNEPGARRFTAPSDPGAEAPEQGEASGKVPAQEFLNWNRSQEKPPVAIGKEMGVYRKAAEFGAAPLSEQKPVAWIRFRSDGGYEGPLMDAAMEDVRKKSGAWTPLYTTPAASPVASVPTLTGEPVPRWIDDAKGKDPFTDDLIAEILRLRAQAGAPIATKKRNEELHSLMLGQSVVFHKFVWPAELHSGVMFFNGQRITRAEFEARAALAKMEGASNGN